MFNFTTTTIINSDKDTSGNALFTTEKVGGSETENVLRIKRDFSFKKEGIKKVYKKAGAEPVMGEITVDCTALLAAVPADSVYPVSGRIALYMALEGSEESYLANDFYQKGHPISIGYIIKSKTATANDLANAIVKAATRFNVATVGKRLFTVKADAAKVTFKCADEYLRFKNIAVLMDNGMGEDCLVSLYDGEQGSAQTVIAFVNRGSNGFGTFRNLVKDLRLPTVANTEWTALRKSERPVPGALYTQYIITYTAQSGTNPSLAAVGHMTDSTTTHVFWVKSDIVAAFDAEVAKVAGAAGDTNDSVFENVSK